MLLISRVMTVTYFSEPWQGEINSNDEWNKQTYFSPLWHNLFITSSRVFCCFGQFFNNVILLPRLTRLKSEALGSFRKLRKPSRHRWRSSAVFQNACSRQSKVGVSLFSVALGLSFQALHVYYDRSTLSALTLLVQHLWKKNWQQGHVPTFHRGTAMDLHGPDDLNFTKQFIMHCVYIVGQEVIL